MKYSNGVTQEWDVVRADARYLTDFGWLHSRHSFSFGGHHHPDNTHHGLLLVHNDDIVAPGGGFGTHPHRDMEIVTWVLDGALEHRDSAGNEGVIRPGLAQRMSAGSGITHSEMNHSAGEPVRFIQMWVPPDTLGITPGYEQLDVGDALASGSLVPVASGQGHDGAIVIHQKDAVLFAARPPRGTELVIPDGPHVHLFIARGGARFADEVLGQGDAVRLTDASEAMLDITEPDTELLVWQTS